jgi:RHS repeat-associated protein
MVNSSQSMVASYRYDPFGNSISSSGTLASANVYRFSGKEIHVNSGMYYYGYRFYDPNFQRWTSRDPMEEIAFWVLPRAELRRKTAFENLYLFVRNDGLNLYDPFGLDENKIPPNNYEECVENCDRDKQQRIIAYATKHTGARVLGYVVFSGAAVVGGLLCPTPALPAGVALIVIGVAGDIFEWIHNSRADRKFDRDNQKQYDNCVAICKRRFPSE